MLRKELEYELPPDRIAQRPAQPRDASRLLVLHRKSRQIEHRVFREIGEYLHPGDVLARNDTRVVPARFHCRRRTGGRIEALYLHRGAEGWHVLLRPTARLRVGERLRCENEDHALLLRSRRARGEWIVTPEPAIEPLELLDRVGHTPLPPYIQRTPVPDAADAQRYQTVYARRAGAVAAPTAGLHFTPALLERLQAAGVETCDLTLHVGVGTFAPIDVPNLADHEMHGEWMEIDVETLARLHRARAEGHRIVAVGTTSVRVLESLPDHLGHGPCPAVGRSGWTNVFIYPPYAFGNVDVLLTNFHLPGSTLLALVMAFAGVEATRAAYAAAIECGYRFYSYGDAMLIL